MDRHLERHPCLPPVQAAREKRCRTRNCVVVDKAGVAAAQTETTQQRRTVDESVAPHQHRRQRILKRARGQCSEYSGPGNVSEELAGIGSADAGLLDLQTHSPLWMHRRHTLEHFVGDAPRRDKDNAEHADESHRAANACNSELHRGASAERTKSWYHRHDSKRSEGERDERFGELLCVRRNVKPDQTRCVRRRGASGGG